MMSASAVLEMRFSGRNAEQGLKGFRNSLSETGKAGSSLQKTMGAVGKAVVALAAAMKALSVVSDAVKEFAKFESAMSEVSAITGATGKDLKFLSDQARELGATTSFSAAEAAKAFKLVASAKPELLETAGALVDVTKEVLTLSEASGIELTSAASLVGEALNQFGVGADQAARFVNVLAAGSKYGASEVRETGEALKNAGSIAASVGISFEDTTAAIQILAASGIKASEAGTGLKGVLAALEKQNNDDFKPSIVGIEQALLNLQRENLNTAETFAMFGQESAPAVLALIKNADGFGELSEKITGTGVASEQARTQMDNLSGDWKSMQSALSELKIAVVEAFGGDLRGIVQAFTQTIRDVAGAAAGLSIAWEKAKGFMVAVFGELAARWLEASAWIMEGIEELAPVFDGVAKFMIKLWSAQIDVMAMVSPMIEAVVKGVLDGVGLIIGGISKIFSALGGKKFAKALEGVAEGVWKSSQGLTGKITGLIGDTQKKAHELSETFSLGLEGNLSRLANNSRQMADQVRKTTGEMERDSLAKVAAMTAETRELGDAADETGVKLENVSAETEEFARRQEELEKISQKQKETLKDLNQSYDDQIKLLKIQGEQYGLSKEELSVIKKLIEDEIDLNSDAAQGILDKARAVADLTEEQERNNRAREEAERFVEDWELAASAIAEETAALVDNERARAKIRAEKMLLGRVTEEEIQRVYGLIDAYYDQAEAIELTRQLYDDLKRGLTGFFTDFLETGRLSVDTFVDYLKNRFIAVLAEMAAEKLVISLQENGFNMRFLSDLFGGGRDGDQPGGSGGGGQGPNSGQGINYAALLGGIATLYSIYESDQRGTTQSQVGGLFAGAATGAAVGGVWGAVIGAVLGAFAGGAFTGTDWSDVGSRIAVEVANGMLESVTSVTEQERHRSWFRGREWRDVEDELNDIEAAPFLTQFEKIVEAVRSGAQILGLEIDEILANFEAGFDVDLTDLDADQQQAAINAAFREIYSDLAEQVLPFADLFRKTGEDYAATFERLVASVSVAERGLEALGVSVESLMGDSFVSGVAEAMVESIQNDLYREVERIRDDMEIYAPGGERPDAQMYSELEDELQAVLDEIAAVTVQWSEAVQVAGIAYREALAEAAGGPEALAELFDAYVTTFVDSSESAERLLVGEIGRLTTQLDAMLADLGVGRDDLISTFEGELAAGDMDPERLVAFLQAAQALAQIMELEIQLAAARGEAVQVTSLSADQVRILTEQSGELLKSFEAFGVTLGVSSEDLNQFVLDIAASVGSIEGIADGLGFIFSNFFTEAEQMQMAFDSAAETIESAGYTVEEFAEGGKQHFVDLFKAALESGNQELIAVLIAIAPAVLTVIEAGESLNLTVEDMAGSISYLDEQFGMVGIAFDLAGDSASLFVQGLIDEFGSLEAVGDRLSFVYNRFLTDQERAVREYQAASQAIEAAGLSVADFAVNGRQKFIDMLDAAVAAGDTELVKMLLDLAPAIDIVITHFENLEGSVTAVGESARSTDSAMRSLGGSVRSAAAAAGEAGQDFQALRSAIDQTMSNIRASIQRVLSQSASAINSVGGASGSSGIQSRIDTLYGRMGSGSLMSQVQDINELQSLVVARYESEREQIMSSVAAERAAIQASNEAKMAAYQGEKAHYEEMLKNHERALSVAKSLKSFLQSLEFQAAGGNSPYETFLVAQSAFSEVLAAALGGDVNAAEGLQDAAQQYLDAAREVFGSSPQFFDIVDAVTAGVNSVITALEATPSPEPPQIPHLIRITSTTGMTAEHTRRLTELEQETIAELEALEAELRRLQEEAERQEAEWRNGLLDSNRETVTVLRQIERNTASGGPTRDPNGMPDRTGDPRGGVTTGNGDQRDGTRGEVEQTRHTEVMDVMRNVSESSGEVAKGVQALSVEVADLTGVFEETLERIISVDAGVANLNAVMFTVGESLEALGEQFASTGSGLSSLPAAIGAAVESAMDRASDRIVTAVNSVEDAINRQTERMSENSGGEEGDGDGGGSGGRTTVTNTRPTPQRNQFRTGFMRR